MQLGDVARIFRQRLRGERLDPGGRISSTQGGRCLGGALRAVRCRSWGCRLGYGRRRWDVSGRSIRRVAIRISAAATPDPTSQRLTRGAVPARSTRKHPAGEVGRAGIGAEARRRQHAAAVGAAPRVPTSPCRRRKVARQTCARTVASLRPRLRAMTPNGWSSSTWSSSGVRTRSGSAATSFQTAASGSELVDAGDGAVAAAAIASAATDASRRRRALWARTSIRALLAMMPMSQAWTGTPVGTRTRPVARSRKAACTASSARSASPVDRAANRTPAAAWARYSASTASLEPAVASFRRACSWASGMGSMVSTSVGASSDAAWLGWWAACTPPGCRRSTGRCKKTARQQLSDAYRQQCSTCRAFAMAHGGPATRWSRPRRGRPASALPNA